MQQTLKQLLKATYVDDEGGWTKAADDNIKGVFKHLDGIDAEVLFGDEDAVMPVTKGAPDLDASNPSHRVAAMKVMLSHFSVCDWTPEVCEGLEEFLVF